MQTKEMIMMKYGNVDLLVTKRSQTVCVDITKQDE